MSNSRLNTNYKIPDKTLNTTSMVIDRIGFDASFEIALARSLTEMSSNPESIIITQYMSWSHHLSNRANESAGDEANRLREAACFYRKLAHHVYWDSLKKGIVERNPYFIQAVE